MAGAEDNDRVFSEMEKFFLDFEKSFGQDIESEITSWNVNQATADQVTMKEAFLSTRPSFVETQIDEFSDEFESLDENFFDDEDGENFEPPRASTPVIVNEIPDDTVIHENTEIQTFVDSERNNSENFSWNRESDTFNTYSNAKSISIHPNTFEDTQSGNQSNKENEPPIAHILPRLSKAEIQKSNKKRKGRKRKYPFMDEITELPPIDIKNLNNNDIYSQYGVTKFEDLKLAVRKFNVECIKKAKLPTLKELFERPLRSLPVELLPRYEKSIQLSKKRVASENIQSKSKRQKISKIEIPKALSNDKAASSSSVGVHVIDMNKPGPSGEPNPMEALVQSFSGLNPNDLPLESHVKPMELEPTEPGESLTIPNVNPKTLRRVKSDQFVPNPPTSPLVYSQTAAVGARKSTHNDHLNQIKLEWGEQGMLKKLLPEMIDVPNSPEPKPVKFSSLNSKFKSRMEAAIAFTSLINLKAKGILEISKDEASTPKDIKIGEKLKDNNASLQDTMMSFCLTDVEQ